jgi:uncharacterized membrane protein
LGLRSQSLLVLLAAVTAVLLAAVLWHWPTLARRGAVAMAMRIGLLAALQVSVLGLVFVSVNRSQEFYASWSDLLGTNPIAGRIIPVSGAGQQGGRTRLAGPAALLAGAPVPVPVPRAARGPGGPPPAGRLQAVRFTGPVSGISVRGYLLLPPGYSGTGPRLPVIVMISSQVHSSTAAYGARRAAAIAVTAMAAGRLPKLIMVMLPPAVAGQADQGCLDIPGGPQAAAFFTQDLPQEVRSALRAALQPAQWAVLGGAGGGYCALQLATSAAGPFAVAAAPPGTYTAPPGAAPGTAWLRRQDNLLWRLRRWPPPPVRVLLTGPGSAGWQALVRPPLRTAVAGSGAGAQRLAGVLRWVGRALAAT